MKQKGPAQVGGEKQGSVGRGMKTAVKGGFAKLRGRKGGGKGDKDNNLKDEKRQIFRKGKGCITRGALRRDKKKKKNRKKGNGVKKKWGGLKGHW